jgi:CRP-like cAMP-binding protein
MPLSNLIKNLNRIYQFSDYEISKITSLVKTKKYKKRELILTQGEPNRIFGYINNGLCKSYTTDNKQTVHIIQLLKEDYWLSDVFSHSTGKGSHTSVECIEDTLLHYFEYENLEQLYLLIPKFESYCRKMLLNRVVKMSEDRFDLLSLNAEERYTKFLNKHDDLTQRISQKDIASYLGIFPESLSRIRRQLANK